MIKLGLTGSIGMGKSTTAGFFRDFGVPVHDADAAVHDLYQSEAVEAVAALFDDVVSGGAVDRKKLSNHVLADPNALKKLEAVVHPMVLARENAFLKAAAADRASLVVLDIPLLFETGASARVDKILVVTAPQDVQRARVLSRLGMDEEKFAAILSRQRPDADKRACADYIIDTSKGFDYARDAVSAIISNLT